MTELDATATRAPVAVVTGAAGGIGCAVVERLVRAGTVVAAFDVDPAVEELALEAPSGRVVPFVVDLRDAVRTEAALAEAVAALGPVGVLVNNAGVMHKKPLPDHTLDDWELEMAVNARAVFVLCRAVLPSMAARGSGVVVNVASIWATRGGPDRAAYVAAKHAVLGLTRALAAEYGPCGVRVNAINPGPVRTPMTSSLGGDQSDWMEPAEVADAIAFLCSDAAHGVNGAELDVFGRGRPAGL